MTKALFFSILFFFFLQHAICQSTPPIQKYEMYYKEPGVDTFMLSMEEIYYYDETNYLLDLKESKTYSFNGSVWLWEGIFYEYYPNQQLKKVSYKNYNPAVDLWIAESFVEYQYDNNNCLVEEIHIENIGGVIDKKIRYESNEHCQWVKQIVEEPAWITNELEVKSFREKEYYSDGISYLQTQYYTTTDSFFIGNWQIREFNSSGTIINLQNIFPGTQNINYLEIKNEYEYDFADNLTRVRSSERKSSSGSWEIKYDRNEYNEYDKEDNLIKKNTEYLFYNTNPPAVNEGTKRQITYSDYCNGIPKKVSTEKLSNGEIIREEFTYFGKNDCINFSKGSLELEVFPNPSSRYFNIISSIFESGNTTVSVFSIDGKLLLQKQISNTLAEYKLDLSILNNGIYFLYLNSGSHAVQEKIVIAN